MPVVTNRLSVAAGAAARAARFAVTGARRRTAALWRRLLDARRPRHIPVVVLVADHRARATLERSLAGGLRRLRRAVALPASPAVTIIAQQALLAEGAGCCMAGCSELAQRPDGGRTVLIRLALQPGGRRLTQEELLAVLAEQWLALAAQLDGRPRVLVPLDVAALSGIAPAAPAPTPSVLARDATPPGESHTTNGRLSVAVKR